MHPKSPYAASLSKMYSPFYSCALSSCVWSNCFVLLFHCRSGCKILNAFFRAWQTHAEIITSVKGNSPAIVLWGRKCKRLNDKRYCLCSTGLHKAEGRVGGDKSDWSTLQHIIALLAYLKTIQIQKKNQCIYKSALLVLSPRSDSGTSPTVQHEKTRKSFQLLGQRCKWIERLRKSRHP